MFCWYGLFAKQLAGLETTTCLSMICLTAGSSLELLQTIGRLTNQYNTLVGV